MIAYVSGTVAYAEAESVVVDYHGMGYRIRTSNNACSSVRPGDEVTFYTYLYVREDVMNLYGFLTREELDTFQILLGVNGVGPKAALSVLSTLSVADLYYAVLGEDSKAIAKTPGIGPKGARRIIVDLKDKLKLEDLEEFPSDSSESEHTVSSDSTAFQDALEALTALGYSNGDAYRALTAVSGSEDMDVETLLKAALAHLI